MANDKQEKRDAMTKPTYEELAQEEIKRLEAELLRVRGLLQRISEVPYAIVPDGKGGHQNCERCAEMLLIASEEPQGAESADIGKLDGVECTCLADAEDFDKNCPAHGYVARFNADGSAETGGEKAGTLGELIERQYPSDPVTGKTIVVRGSREPEKLNNAQKSAAEFVDYAIAMVESGCSVDAIVATLKAAKDALAESSLSSPPPTEYCVFCGKHRSDELHNAGAELLACSSFTVDDYHNFYVPNFRQSSSLSEPGAESAHSGKQNTADKSGLLPTQLPKDK